MLIRSLSTVIVSIWLAFGVSAEQPPVQLEEQARTIHRAVLQAKERITKAEEASPETSAKARWNEYFRAAEMAFRKGDPLRAQIMLGIAEQFSLNLSPLGRDQLDVLKIRVYRDWGEEERGYQRLQSLIAKRKLAGLPTDLKVFYLDRLLEQEDYVSFEWIFRKFYSKMRGEEGSFYRWGKRLLEKKNARLAFLVLSGIQAKNEWYARSLYLRALANILNGDFDKALSFFSECQRAAGESGEKDLAALSLISQGRIHQFLGRKEEAGRSYEAVDLDSLYYPDAQYELFLMRFTEGNYEASWKISALSLVDHPLHEGGSKQWLAQAYSLIAADRLEAAFRVLNSIKERYQGTEKEVERLRELSKLKSDTQPASSNLDAVYFLERVEEQTELEYRRTGIGERIEIFEQGLELLQGVWKDVMVALLPGCRSEQSEKESCRLSGLRTNLYELEDKLKEATRGLIEPGIWERLEKTSPPRKISGVQEEIQRMGSSGDIDLAGLIGAMKREEEAVKARRIWIAWVRKELGSAESSRDPEERNKINAAWGLVLEAETDLGFLEKKIVARETEHYLKFNPLVKKLAVTIPSIENKMKTIKGEAERIRRGISELKLKEILEEEEQIYLQGLAVLKDISVSTSGRGQEAEEMRERFTTYSLSRPVGELKLEDRLKQLSKNMIVELLRTLEEQILDSQKSGLIS